MPPSPGIEKLKNRGLALGVAVCFAFGLVVPAFVLVDNGKHKASSDVGIHLTAQETKGRELFAEECNLCHMISAVKSVARIGPNLNVLVGDQIKGYAARRAFVLTTILNGLSIGKGNMPALLYDGKEAEDVADFVAAVASH